MVHGYFPYGKNVPYVEVSIFSGKKILRSDFILDTGFSGYLKIDKKTAAEFGIVSFGGAGGINANDEYVNGDFANGYAELEGKKELVEILIFDGPPLAGIGLFAAFGYKVVVDCKNRTVHLESAA